MQPPKNLELYRQRAAELIRDKLGDTDLVKTILRWEDIPAPASDSKVDDFIRELYGLPARPAGDYPYVGYITGIKPVVESSSSEESIIYQLASRYDLDPNLIKTIIKVETPRGPFLPSGRVTVLYEAHWFSYLTKGKYDSTHPKLSSEQWNRSLYLGGESEWGRIEAAAELDWTAAYSSASYGAGQVLGVNWSMCKFKNLSDFLKHQQTLDGQIDTIFRFIVGKGLMSALKAHDWDAFGYGYNGEGYKTNGYDTKLEVAFAEVSA